MVEKKIRTILVGCGGMSRAWLATATKLPEVEVVGLVDIVEAAARQRADEYGLSQAVIGTDLRSVIELTRPDAVFNCTIPEAHYDVTMLALEQGCHVLSEKPLANSMAEAQTMVATAQKVGKVFSVIQNRRYDPNIRRLRSFVQSGEIGSLTTVNSDFYIGAHFGGFRDHMRHVLLLDMAIHTFDAARLIMKADPVSVYCHEWNPPGSWYDHDASAIALFEMSNGIVYTYRGSWCADGLPTTWEADWRVVGQQGSVLWNGASQLRAQKVGATGGFTSEYQDIVIPNEPIIGAVGGHDGVIREFFSSILNGTKPETTAEDNIKSLAMVFGAIESAETGKKVTISW